MVWQGELVSMKHEPVDRTPRCPAPRRRELAITGLLVALLALPLAGRTQDPAASDAGDPIALQEESLKQWSVVHPLEFRHVLTALARVFEIPPDWISSSEPPHPDLARPELVQFVDKTFGLGLRAWVVPDSGEWLQSDAHGWTWIPLDLQGQHLWVYADGCYPQEFEPGSLESRNSMSPSCWSILRVVTADGDPVAGVEVTWWSDYPRGDRYKPGLISGGRGKLTTSEGFAWIATARASFVDLGNWDLPNRRKVRVPSCASIVIEQPRAPCMLRLGSPDSDEMGIHAQLEVTAPADRFDIAQSDGVGLSGGMFIQPRVGPLVVELQENSCSPSDTLAVGWSRLGPTTVAFWGSAEHDTEIEDQLPSARLAVERNSVRLWLKDRESQFGLYRPVRIRVVPGAGAGGVVPVDSEVAMDSPGGLGLPETLVDELREHGGTLEIWPFGAKPELLQHGDFIGVEEGAVVHVEFDRAQEKLIRVVDRAGRSFSPRLSLSTGDGAEYSEGVGAHGIYTLDWIGGDVIVRAELPSTGLPDGELVELARIPAATLEMGFGVDLHVGIELGTVEVHGANWRGTDIVLVDHTGKEHRPARRDADRVTFVDVPPGPLSVAPHHWAQQWWTRREAGGAVDSLWLGSGNLLRVPWNDAWSSERERAGTVGYAASRVHGLFLVPCYGSTDEPVPLDLEAAWSSIDSEGGYKIAERDPIPSALLVCSLPEDGGVLTGNVGKLLVHEVIEAGESVDLPLGEVELVWEAEEWDGPLRITWEQSRGECHHPQAELLARNATTSCGAAWPVSENRVLKRLTPGAMTLQFESARASWTETVEVEAGSRVVLRVRE